MTSMPSTITYFTVEFYDGINGAWFRYDDAETSDEVDSLIFRLRESANPRIRVIEKTVTEV